MAAIGQIERFNPDKLAAYVGLNPSVYHSGDGPAFHGRITKRGRLERLSLAGRSRLRDRAQSPGTPARLL